MTLDSQIKCLFKSRLGQFDLDIDMSLPARGVTAIFGPTGSGKTTIMRCLAGLYKASVGHLVVNGETWQDSSYFRPTHERAIGYVFQEASLFPHLTVQKNLLYGAGNKKPNELDNFDKIISLLGLETLLERSPQNLSGGERQRAAIGRALLSAPKVLLMDEPLSALDHSTKQEIMPFMEKLHDELELPIIYVTHDMNEIEQIADHLVLIASGKVQASGKLTAIQSDPSLPLAGSYDAAVSLDGTLVSYDQIFGIARFSVMGGFLNVPSHPMILGTKRRLKIFASDVSLTWDGKHKSTIDNILPVIVMDMQETSSSQVTAILSLGLDKTGDGILARVTKRSWETLGLEKDQNLFAQVKGVSLVRPDI
ncbi:MAG: molybdenum ABC transporter ATP-binding protein [Methylocystis sp.]